MSLVSVIDQMCILNIVKFLGSGVRDIIHLTYLNKDIRSALVTTKIGQKCLKVYYRQALANRIPKPVLQLITKHNGALTGSSTLEIFEECDFSHNKYISRTDMDYFFKDRTTCVAFINDIITLSDDFYHSEQIYSRMIKKDTEHDDISESFINASDHEKQKIRRNRFNINDDIFNDETKVAYKRCGYINSINYMDRTTNYKYMDVLDMSVGTVDDFDMTICSNLIWTSGKSKWCDVQSILSHYIKFHESFKKYALYALRNDIDISKHVDRCYKYQARGYIMKDDVLSLANNNDIHKQFNKLNCV